MLIALGLWLLLAAPGLRRGAEASPVGARRNVSLALLTPLAWISERTRLADATGSVQRALGRDPDAAAGGQLALGGEPAPIPDDFGLDGGESSPDQMSDTPLAPLLERPNLRTPTVADKLRVVVIGDSMAIGLGTAVARAFNPSLVNVAQQGRVSTGLARPDYFDWPRAMEQITTRYRPDIVVVMLGGNDNQSVIYSDGDVVPGGGEEWNRAYRAQIQDFLEAATSHGAAVAWVGLPPVPADSPVPGEILQSYNNLYRQEAARHGEVAFLDLGEQFTDNGQYDAYGRDEDGNVVLLRAGDGVHFTPDGYDLIAERLTSYAIKNWGLAQRAADK